MTQPDNALIDAARGRDPIVWKFIEFNDRRWLRGAPAAAKVFKRIAHGAL